MNQEKNNTDEVQNIKSEEKTDIQSESKVKIEREVKTELKTEVKAELKPEVDLKAELKTEVKHDVTQNGDDKKEVKHVSSENGDGNKSANGNVDLIKMNHDGDCETTLEYSVDGDTTVDYIEDVKEDVKQENATRLDVVQKINEAHDSVVPVSKPVCRAKHPLPANKCVDAFMQKLKDKKANHEKEEKEEKDTEEIIPEKLKVKHEETNKEKNKEDFIPACLDESVVDVSAMASNAIAFVLKGNFINIYNYKYSQMSIMYNYIFLFTSVFHYFRARNYQTKAKRERSSVKTSTSRICNKSKKHQERK